MAVSVNIFGARKAGIMLAGALKNIKIGTAEGLRDAAFFMQGEIKASIAGRRNEPTSVDTGRLLNSIDIEVSTKNASIFTLVPYGKFIEFGTTRFSGRHHFRNSLARNEEKIRQFISDSI